MDTKRVRTGHKRGEVAPNTWADFEWAREHREALFNQYGNIMVLIFEQKVVGKGTTYEEAIQDAEHNLPADFTGEITPIIYVPRHPHDWFYTRLLLQQLREFSG